MLPDKNIFYQVERIYVIFLLLYKLPAIKMRIRQYKTSFRQQIQFSIYGIVRILVG